MTQKELDLGFQQLNMEYQKKKNEIARKKQDVEAKKQEALLKADDDFHAQKQARLGKISEIRIQKAQLFLGDINRAVLEAEARNLEDEISVMRDDNDRYKRTIIKEAYDEYRLLEDQSRIDAEWHESEKHKLMKEYLNQDNATA